MKRKLGAIIAAGALALGLSACGQTDAKVVNENMTKECDNFQCNRQVVFYNAILGTNIMVVEGFCSVDPGDANRMTVTCKTGEGRYQRSALGKSDNVLWFYNPLSSQGVSADHYKVILKPSTVLPDIEVR